RLGHRARGHEPRMTYEPETRAPESDAAQAVRTAGRGLPWIVIAVAVVVVVGGVLLLGPFGLAIALPALLVIWFAAGSTSGGPAAGAEPKRLRAGRRPRR